MRIMACLIGLVVLTGCPGAVGPEATAGRATVGEVFAKCGDMGLVDVQIDAFLYFARIDRDNGTTEVQGARNSLLLCEDQSGIPEGRCLICMTFMMDFVYGE